MIIKIHVFVTAVLTQVLLLSSACQKQPEVTANDLADAQSIAPLIVQVPQKVPEQNWLYLEKETKSGTTYRDLGVDVDAGTVVKLFFDRGMSGTFSCILEGTHYRSIENDISGFFEGKSLHALIGPPTVHQTGDVIAIFSVDDETSWTELGEDDAWIRVTVKERREQDGTGQPM